MTTARSRKQDKELPKSAAAKIEKPLLLSQKPANVKVTKTAKGKSQSGKKTENKVGRVQLHA